MSEPVQEQTPMQALSAAVAALGTALKGRNTQRTEVSDARDTATALQVELATAQSAVTTAETGLSSHSPLLTDAKAAVHTAVDAIS